MSSLKTGRPSINKVGAAFLSVTLPSISTFNAGIFRINSVAVCPEPIKFLSTLNTFLSIPNCNPGLDEVTVTFSSVLSSISILILNIFLFFEVAVAF